MPAPDILFPADAADQLPADGGLGWGVASLQVTFAGGVRSLELSLTDEHLAKEEGGCQLDLVLTDSHFPLQVVLHYLVHDDSDVIERWVTLRHTGTSDQPVQVTRADSGNWLLPELPDYRCTAVSGGWAAEAQLRRVPVPIGELTWTSRQGITSHQANPWVMIDDGTTVEDRGQVWGVALAWSGSWRVTAQRRPDGLTSVTAGFGHDGLSWTLAPGQELTTPRVLGLYSDGGFGAASRAWHRYARAHVLPHPDELRPVLYNSWEATEFDIDEAGQLELARLAADLGVELFVMDDGWFGGRVNDRAGLGDWWPNPDRFPNGLHPLADEVRRLGMQFGLWVEPEMVNPDSELYRAHPDWVLHFPHRRRDLKRNQLVLNFARTDVQEWALKWLDDLVERNRIDFLKWDMNRSFAQAGWPERAGDQDRLWIDHPRGVYAVIDQLRQRHPKLRIEGCASGGGRIDYAMLARTDEVWTSDNTDAYHRQSIQHGYSQLYPAATMAAWITDSPNAITGRCVPLAYRFHVAMAGVLGIGGDLRNWTTDELRQARALVASYKEVRATVQHGTQYRLAGEVGQGLSAVQYVHGDDVVVLVYLPHATVRRAPGTLRLAGLDPDGTYCSADGDAGEDPRGVLPAQVRTTGRVLMASGLPLYWPAVPGGDWFSAVVRLRQIR